MVNERKKKAGARGLEVYVWTKSSAQIVGKVLLYSPCSIKWWQDRGARTAMEQKNWRCKTHGGAALDPMTLSTTIEQRSGQMAVRWPCFAMPGYAGGFVRRKEARKFLKATLVG